MKIDTMVYEMNAEQSTEQEIRITPIVKSGIGSFMCVKIADKEYVSEITQNQFDTAEMGKHTESICSKLSENEAIAVAKKFEEFGKAEENTKIEQAYREQHPEEFLENTILNNSK